jgi:hypothetical protein
MYVHIHTTCLKCTLHRVEHQPGFLVFGPKIDRAISIPPFNWKTWLYNNLFLQRNSRYAFPGCSSVCKTLMGKCRVNLTKRDSFNKTCLACNPWPRSTDVGYGRGRATDFQEFNFILKSGSTMQFTAEQNDMIYLYSFVRKIFFLLQAFPISKTLLTATYHCIGPVHISLSYLQYT